MPGFMPGIHVFRHCNFKDGDGRNKSGHDDDMLQSERTRLKLIVSLL
jgi:hypothetical protein